MPHETSQHQCPAPRYSCIVCEIGACDPDVCFYETKDLLITSDGTRLCHPCAKKHFRDISHLLKFAPTEHPDATAVGRFAAVMKAKLAQKRAEGRGGWEDKQECTSETLSAMLIACVRKGDPIDVANLAMMLHQRGEQINALEVDLFAQEQDVAREPEFTISFTGTDGCATVLSHWPEGYALQRHGEIVWRENTPPAQTLDKRMKSAGMYTIEEMLGVTPLTKWNSNPAINTVEHFSEWLDQKTAEYLRMKAGYDLGDKSVDDGLYEWVLAHTGVFSTIRDQFRVVTAAPATKREGLQHGR